jgi:Zinc knuckle
MFSAGGPSAVYHEEDEVGKVGGRPHATVTEASGRLPETGLFHMSTPASHQTSYEASGRRFVKRKEMEVRRFTGKDSVEDYLLQFELAARHNYWTNQEKASSLLCALDGPARGVLAEIDDPATVSYDEVRKALLARFGPADFPAAHEQALHQLRLSPGQNIRELSQEVQRLTKRAYSDLTGRARSQLMIGFLLRAIPDREVVFYIRDKEPSNLDEACCLYERFRLLSSTDGHRQRATRAVSSEEPNEERPSTVFQSFMDRTSQSLEQMSNVLKGFAVSSPSAAPREAPSFRPMTKTQGNIPRKPCPQCGQAGHWSRECPLQNGPTEAANRAPCFECGQPGHRWRRCPALQHSGNDRGPTSAPDGRSVAPHPRQ